MRAVNLTSYISIDPVHGPIVMMHIDDMPGHIEFFFTNGVATQATAEKEHNQFIRNAEFISDGHNKLSTGNVMGCLIDMASRTEIPYDMIKQMLLNTHSSKKSMSLTVTNCFAKG